MKQAPFCVVYNTGAAWYDNQKIGARGAAVAVVLTVAFGN
jgi:hypothetical protein